MNSTKFNLFTVELTLGTWKLVNPCATEYFAMTPRDTELFIESQFCGPVLFCRSQYRILNT